MAYLQSKTTSRDVLKEIKELKEWLDRPKEVKAQEFRELVLQYDTIYHRFKLLLAKRYDKALKEKDSYRKEQLTEQINFLEHVYRDTIATIKPRL